VCDTTEFKPSENQSCGTCSSGATQGCNTAEGCGGTQVCVNGSWSTCIDIANDGCPTSAMQKEIVVTITPEALKDEMPFTVIVKNKTGILLSNTKVEYAEKRYFTNSEGKVTLETQKEFSLLTISKSGYITQNITLNITTPFCGNNKCEQPEENIDLCPQDCTPLIKELQITTSVSNNLITVNITDIQENPIENAEVIYGNETINTNQEGIIVFNELPGTNTITAKKTGYQTKTIIYSSTQCENGAIEQCKTTEGCNGTQTCTNGTWNNCKDVPGDKCPTEEEVGVVTIVLAVILLIGVTIFIITKTITK